MIAGCGGSSGKTATLNWYIFPEQSGSFAAAAQQCSAASHGSYKIAKVMGYATYPSVAPGRPTKVTIGGINLGVSSFSKHPADDFKAIECLVSAQHQKVDAIKGGLPPTLASLYDDPALAKPYPVHALIKQALQNFGIRPQTPQYSRPANYSGIFKQSLFTDAPRNSIVTSRIQQQWGTTTIYV